MYYYTQNKTLSIDNWFGSFWIWRFGESSQELRLRDLGAHLTSAALPGPRGVWHAAEGAVTPGGARRSPAPVEKKNMGKRVENGGFQWISGISLRNKLGLHGQKWWNIDKNSRFFCGFCSTKKVFHEQNHGVWIGVRQKQTHIFAAKLLPGKNNTGISLNSSQSHGLVPLLHPEKVVVSIGEHIPLTSKLFTLFSSAASEITGRKVDSVWSFCSFLDVFLGNVV